MEPISALGMTSSTWDIAKGIISIAGDLYDYYRAWKDCDEDVRVLRAKLLWLHKAFTFTRNELQRPDLDDTGRSLIATAVKSCEAAKDDLASTLNSIKKLGTPHTVLGKLKQLGRKACYPFKKGTIVDMLEEIDSCISALDLAVNLLGLDASATILNSLHEVGEKLTAGLDNVEVRLSDLRISSNSLLHESHTRRDDDIVKWLDAPRQDFLTSSVPEPGTNQWFLHGAAFSQWRKHQRSALLLHGSIGCGKTTLLTAIVEQLRNELPPSVSAYRRRVVAFCFSGSNLQNADLEGFIRTLLSQLSAPGRLDPLLETFYEKHHHVFRSRPSLEDMKALILQMLQHQQAETFILVDGLDEAPYGEARRLTVAFLDGIASHMQGCCHLLVTSRSEEDILDSLRCHPYWKVEAIPKTAVRNDIRLYTEREIDRHLRLKTLTKDTQKLIIDRLTYDENDMFRWAALQLESLKRLRPLMPRSVQRALASLPETLSETYGRILSDIPEDIFPLASAALQWLMFACKPLSVAQLVDAIAISADEGVVWDDRASLNERTLLEILPNLISVTGGFGGDGEDTRDSETTYVQFAHFSVREYPATQAFVDRIPHPLGHGPLQVVRTASSVETKLADRCLAYLLRFNSRSLSTCYFPLRTYAYTCWYIHAARATRQERSPSRLFKEDDMSVEELEDYICLWPQSLCGATAHSWFPSSPNGDPPISPRSDSTGELLTSVRNRFFAGYPGDQKTPKFWGASIGESSISRKWVASSSVAHTLHPVRPLRRPDEDVRLLHLMPPGYDRRIRARMHHASLSDPMLNFVALSYGLDMPELSGRILIDGFECATMTSTVEALKAIQRDVLLRDAAVWTDSLCVTSYDDRNDSVLVSTMDRICEAAKEVWIYIGGSNGTVDWAIDITTELSRLMQLSPEGLDSPGRESLLSLLARRQGEDPYKALIELFSLRWWTRIWPIRRYVRAKSVMFIVGTRTLPSTIFEPVVNEMTTATTFLDQALGQHTTSSWTFLRDNRVVRVQLLARLRAAWVKKEPPGLIDVLHASRWHSSRHRSDRFYAVSGLYAGLDDRTSIDLPMADYALTPARVAHLYCKHLIQVDRILVARGQHEGSPSDPSWVTSFTPRGNTNESLSLLYTSRSSFIHSTFDAGGPMRIPASFPRNGCVRLQCLRVAALETAVTTAQSHLQGADPGELSEASPYVALRKWMLTSEEVHALVPSHARIGDIIAVFTGYRIPFVIRANDSYNYILIGDCFMSGIMYGEAIQRLTTGELDSLAIVDIV